MTITMAMIKELRDLTNVGIMDCKKALTATNGDMSAAVQWLRTHGIAKAQAKQNRLNIQGLTKALVKNNQAIILELNCETDFVAKNELFHNLLNEIVDLFLINNPKNLEAGLELLNSDKVSVNDLLQEATYKLGEKVSISRFLIVNKNDNETFAAYNYGSYRIASLVKFQGQALDRDIFNKIAMHVVASKPTFISSADIPQDIIDKEMEIINNQMLDDNKPVAILEKIKKGKLAKQLMEYSLLDQPFMFEESQKVSAILDSQNIVVIAMYRYEVGEITSNINN